MALNQMLPRYRVRMEVEDIVEPHHQQGWKPHHTISMSNFEQINRMLERDLGENSEKS